MQDDFYRSAEIRWFLPELDRREQLLRWFRCQDQLARREEGQGDPVAATGPFVKLERVRTDEYLRLPECDTVGVKQRQGKLEIKVRVAGPRPFSLGVVVGRMEQWVKWSFDPSDKTFQDGGTFAQQLESELDQSGPWCKVAKLRFLQKVSFDAGSLVAVSPDEWPSIGCNIELTAIDVDVNVRTWLTLGFEAFGPSSQAVAVLDKAVAHFFAAHGPPPVQLDDRNSLSYPAWLALLQ